MLIDDYLNRVLLPLFKPGVRVLGVSDSCHSETIFFVPAALGVGPPDGDLLVHDVDRTLTNDEPVTGIGQSFNGTRRAISDAARRQHFEGSRDFYKDLREVIPSRETAPPVTASVLLLAACSDIQDAADGDPHGAFTQALLNVWDSGNFTGNYNDFLREIGENLIGIPQTPGLTPVGTTDPEFIAQRPFFIL
jgi:caspase domain-containing protein